MSNLKTLCEEYFNVFSNKDLGSLAKLFHSDVTLKDWTYHAKGVDAVLDVNKSIFDSVDTIRVIPIWLHQDTNTVACQLQIFVNENISEKLEILDVADFITFENDKIIYIQAYKG
jgi:hypothetical protein